MSKRKGIKKVAWFCVILCLVLVILFGGLQILESTFLSKTQIEGDQATSKTIVRDGVEYFPRQDITVMMILGIDEYGPVKDSGFHVNDGESDMIALLILDETNEEYSILSLNRDTMVEMPVMGIDGKQAGTEYGQLALSHSTGSGLEDSCELTRTTVSNFLSGIRIDYYLSMNMDAIAIMNDAVGGVTVTIEDDFTHLDPQMQKGQMTLMGRQAVTFVRSRRQVGDHLNVSRMRRQKEYMEKFMLAFQEKSEKSDSFVLSAYNDISPYIVTDCSPTVLTSMMQRNSHYTLKEFVEPEGENILGEEYYEFYVDEEKLDELVLRLFYAPKN